ncbi:MAG: hypothetical protein ACM3UT_12880 [Chloroflexota bacterium]
MKRLSALYFILFLFLKSAGQSPVGTWTDHLVYSTAASVAVGTADVYASTGSSILVYNKSLSELRKLSHVNGLTETGISSIAWSEEYKTLVITYTSTNLDLVSKGAIYNLPDIDRKYIPGKKTIYRIRTSGKYAYIASSFGIVVVDLAKREIFDTWKPGSSTGNTEVFDVAFGNGKIFAATDHGVYSASLNSTGLSYSGNWSLVPYLPDPSGKYNALLFTGNRLLVNLSNAVSGGDSVYLIDDSGATLFFYESGVFNTSFDPATTGFTIANSRELRYYDASGNLLKKITDYGLAAPSVSQGIVENDDAWIADQNNGLVHGKNMANFEALSLPGPVSNTAFSISSFNGKTIITGGGATVSWNNVWRPFRVSVNENNGWSPLAAPGLSDAMRALVDPNDNNHVFITTWGAGLLEYRGRELVKRYNDSNSPLQTIIAGAPYVRVCGMAMDKNRNLWITQTEVPSSLKVLKADGSWLFNFERIDAPTIGDIIIAKNGYKWVTLPRGHGLYVLDDRETPENTGDDRDIHMHIRDSDDKIISNVFSIASDLDGVIWVGTDQGPFLYYNPEKIFDEEVIYGFRIKIPRNDGSDLADYMLKTETITAIAIDGGNRKWLGTQSSGVYLLSSDGTQELAHYDEENSPLLSNSITSLAVDNKSGEVWIGTSKGVQSYRGNATGGGEAFGKVYAFPNPVREDYSGNVTITGLMRDTEVKITDVSGNLVWETTSQGGLATWDLNNYRGKRVSTGVYVAFCSSPDGKNSTVTKILVIR